jgi:hypothetical protein
VTSGEKRAASAVILLLLSASLAVVVLERPVWPIVDYPMFSRAQTRRATERTEIYSVERGVETLLPPEQAIFSRDFDSVGARDVVRDLAKSGGDGATRAFLGMVLASLRNGGDSPSAVRLYRERRSFEPGSNRVRIVERRLLAEVEAPR